MSHYLAYGKGQIICPDQGAVAVDAPVEMKRTAAARLPPETPAGNAAVGIFFAQNCPGYVTPAARQLIHTFSQFRARREAWGPYNDIRASIMAAAKTNRTRVGEELSEWCTSAEPRIFAIQEKLGQALR